MNNLPPLKPNDPSLKLTRHVGLKLSKAFKAYYIGREQSSNFNKDQATENIFNAAKETFGNSLVYAERVAATFLFHIKDRDDVVRIYDMHITDENRIKYSDFTVLHETSIFDKK